MLFLKVDIIKSVTRLSDHQSLFFNRIMRYLSYIFLYHRIAIAIAAGLSNGVVPRPGTSVVTESYHIISSQDVTGTF